MAKKKPVEAKTARLEVVVWVDAQMKMREPLNTERLVQCTAGFVVHEDDHQVILASEIVYDTSFMGADMDYTTIPKALVLVRRAMGDIKLDADVLAGEAI